MGGNKGKSITAAVVMISSSFFLASVAWACELGTDPGSAIDPLYGQVHNVLLNVFEKDDRESKPIDPLPNNPLVSIGRLALPGKSCTATLVAGDVILTSAHCLVDDNGALIRSPDASFQVGFRTGSDPTKNVAEAIYRLKWKSLRIGALRPKDDSLNDWALIQLEVPSGGIPPGEKYGKMGLADLVPVLPFPVQTAGYRGTFGPEYSGEWVRNCQIRQTNSKGLLLHDCATESGASGSPLFTFENGSPKIVGLHSGGYVPQDQSPSSSLKGVQWTPDTSNYAVPASQFSDQLRRFIGTKNLQNRNFT